MRIEGVNSALIALVVNDGTGWLEDKLQLVLHVLEHVMPKEMQPYESKGALGNFKSIHCDIWNRYSENVILSF